MEMTTIIIIGNTHKWFEIYHFYVHQSGLSYNLMMFTYFPAPNSFFCVSQL